MFILLNDEHLRYTQISANSDVALAYVDAKVEDH